MSPMSIMVTVMSRFSRRLVETEAFELIAVLISPTTPSRFILSLVPLFSLFFPFKLLRLAIALGLPLLSVPLTTFQLFLRLLHHRERITAHQAAALSFNPARVFVTPDVLTLEVGEHKLARGSTGILAGYSVRCSVPRLVRAFVVPSGVTKSHAVKLLFFLVLRSP